MGLIWVALAASAYKKSQEYHHSSKIMRNGYNGASSNSYSDSSSSECDFNECLFEESSREDSYLKEFFDMIKVKYSEIIERKKEELVQESKKIKASINAPIEGLDELNEALSDSGVQVSIRYNSENYSYHDFDILFNNLQIPREIFYFYSERYDLDKWNLDSLKRELKEVKDDLTEKKTTVEKLQKKLKFTLFNREELKNEINMVINKVQLLEEKEKKLETLLNTYEKVDNLTPELKSLLKAFLSKVIAKKDAMNEYYNIQDEIRNNDYFNNDCFQKALEELTQDGKINENILQRVFLLIDLAEIKYRRKGYETDQYISHSEIRYKMIESFMERLYEMEEEEIKKYCESQETPQTLTKKNN